MVDKTITLEFRIPDRNTPGFLKRQRDVLVFQQQLQDGTSPETLDKLVEFLAQYVVQPEEHQAKVDALWMASEAEFMSLLKALGGQGDDGANPTE